MKKLNFCTSVFLGISLLIFYSCSKKTVEVDNEIQSVIDNAICDQEFMQIQPSINARAIGTKGTGIKKVMLTPCDTLHRLSGDTSFTNPNNPPVFQFDLSLCPDLNGDAVSRSGLVNIILRGKVKTPGSKMIIKLSNYKITNSLGSAITYSCDSMVVTTVSTKTTQTSSNPVEFTFDVDIINGVCTGNGWVIKQSSKRRITTDNKGTFDPSDDITTVTGTADGVSRNGKNFSVKINQLIKPANCKYITSGSLELTPEGLAKRTVDFGAGSCDDDATFTVNGQTIAFKLK